MLVEIACFNLQSCLIAQQAGAHRIELCENHSAGGLTPSEKLILEARSQLQIDLFVMIRPREGNFVYSDVEFELMKEQIQFCKQQKCNGIVFGILTKQNNVNIAQCKELVQLAKPLACTFHRAFDEIENSTQGLEEIINCGFKRILTSGRQKTALEGASLISQLFQKSKENIIIVPGGGIRSSNISELIRKTNSSEIHSAAITDSNETASEVEIKKLISAS